jgi:hypothetical protein
MVVAVETNAVLANILESWNRLIPELSFPQGLIQCNTLYIYCQCEEQPRSRDLLLFRRHLLCSIFSHGTVRSVLFRLLTAEGMSVDMRPSRYIGSVLPTVTLVFKSM